VSRDALPGCGKLRYGLSLLPRAELRQNRALAPGEQLTLVTLTCARSACRDRAPLFAPLDDPRASARSRRYLSLHPRCERLAPDLLPLRGPYSPPRAGVVVELLSDHGPVSLRDLNKQSAICATEMQ
jgi:hypothetical protein